MRVISTAILGLAVMFGSTLHAGENPATGTESLESYINYVSIQPCTSWSYDSNVNGYKCNYYSFRVDVPEYRDVQRLADLVDTLERKIADLEARVARLENQ